MKQYKSLFVESGGSLNVGSVAEAKKIVDISDLVWSEDLSATMNWDEAMSSCPPGWRLPTIQELYTASVQKAQSFQHSNYWSSSTYAQNTNFAWYVNFSNGSVDGSLKANNYYVRCVKEINASYENKIESLLAQHLKKNYNKTPKEITIISRMIERILDEVESRGTPISQMEADKIVMWVSKLLSQS